MAKQRQKTAGDEMLDEIRKVVGRYAGRMSEKECYELLDAEAHGWRMRLEELEEEEADEE